MLEMAIAYTESRFNPDSVGSAEDRGLLQLRPVYIREVNRVAGTDYAPEDAFDPALAVEIFEAMNAYHNPDRDLDTAIALHNRGEAYRARVLENLELIRRYEAARKLIKR
jgi:soluble lytic murein transglycosylase-like protein